MRSEKSGYKIIYMIFLTLQKKKTPLVMFEQLNYEFSLLFSLPSKCNNML